MLRLEHQTGLKCGKGDCQGKILGVDCETLKFSCFESAPNHAVFFDDFAVYMAPTTSKNWIVEIYYETKDNLLVAKTVTDSLFTDLKASKKFSSFQKKMHEIYGEDADKNIESIIKELQIKSQQLRETETPLALKTSPTKDIISGKVGDVVVESIGDKFLCYNAGHISVLPSITHDNVTYIPKEQEPYKPYTPTDYTMPDIKKLYDDVYSVVDDFIDVSVDFKHLITTSIFFTYQQHKSPTTPYLYPIGESGSGKTRVLEILEELAYRPLMATAITGANIYEYLKDGPNGIILDDEVKHSIEHDPDKRAIYLSGYRKSSKVPKIFFGKDHRKQEYYNAYSFKAFTSKELADNDQLLQRCILLTMRKGKPKYGGFREDEDIPRFQDIRNRLLVWRLYTYEQQYFNVRPKDRIDEIFLPLIKTAEFIGNNTAVEAITNIKDADRIEKMNNIRSTIEAKILIAVIRVVLRKKSLTVPFSEIFNELCVVLGGKFDEKGAIISGDFGRITGRYVGIKLRSIFQGQTQLLSFEGKLRQMYNFKKEELRKYTESYFITKEDIQQ